MYREYLARGIDCGKFMYHQKSNFFYGGLRETVFLAGKIYLNVVLMYLLVVFSVDPEVKIIGPYAQTCWSLVNLLHLVNDSANNSDSFIQWFLYSLEHWPTQVLSTMSIVLWSIWKYRNEKLWNEDHRTASVNICLASELLKQWLDARKLVQAPHNLALANDEEIKWKRPPSRYMKCNVNAVTFKETHSIGVAAVVRDSNGEFMVCRMQHYHRLIEVRKAEAKTLLNALTWSNSLDLQHIIFETDFKSVVDAISSNLIDHSEFGTIIAECYSLLSKERYYKVQFVRRQANMAHTLAWAANSHASPCVFYDAPSFISVLIKF